MSQIFPRSANWLSRFSLVAILLLAGLALSVALAVARSSYVTRQRESREQPIQFSHGHHVGGMGIDCRYCHTSVEEAAFAGIPPTKTCMNCHSQLFSDVAYLERVRTSFQTGQPLKWVRVHDLPDFVYFNHSIHVAKGVGCATCHGRIDRMALVHQEAPLTMQWCLDCHTAPEKFLRPREEVFNMAYEAPADQLELGRKLLRDYKIAPVEQLISCSTCHR